MHDINISSNEYSGIDEIHFLSISAVIDLKISNVLFYENSNLPFLKVRNQLDSVNSVVTIKNDVLRFKKFNLTKNINNGASGSLIYV